MKMELAGFVYRTLLRPRPLRLVANALLKAILPATREVGGACIHLNPADPVLSGAVALGVYENDVLAFFEQVIEPEMVLVDAGANVGLYTALGMKHIRPPGRILAIEPDPDSLVFLRRTVRANRERFAAAAVAIHPVALSDRPGSVSLYRNPNNRADNRLFADACCPAAVSVDSATLDGLMDREGLRQIDLLKIDVQGAEAKVVAGAESSLRRSVDGVVISEFWPYGLAGCGSRPEALLDGLEAAGYGLHLFERGCLSPVRDRRILLRRCRGRAYCNLVGLKGRFRQLSGLPL